MLQIERALINLTSFFCYEPKPIRNESISEGTGSSDPEWLFVIRAGKYKSWHVAGDDPGITRIQ
jgi:hypothetical protein